MEITSSVENPGDVLIVVTDPEGTDYVTHFRYSGNAGSGITLAEIIKEGLKGIAWSKQYEKSNKEE